MDSAIKTSFARLMLESQFPHLDSMLLVNVFNSTESIVSLDILSSIFRNLCFGEANSMFIRCVECALLFTQVGLLLTYLLVLRYMLPMTASHLNRLQHNLISMN